MLGGYLNYIIGQVNVEEHGNKITVTGLPTKVLFQDILKVWNTSKISNYLFSSVRGHEFTFNRFYAIDVVYMLESIVKHAKTNSSQRIIKRVIEELSAKTWLARVRTPTPQHYLNFELLKDLTVELLPHQLKFLRIYNQIVPSYGLRGYMLAAAPGAGKTINGLALHHAADNDVCICIVPNNSVETVWTNTISGLYKKPATWWSTKCNRPFDPNCEYFVFHYEYLSKALSLLKNLRGKRVTVILDESHNLNELDSARTNNFLMLCKLVNAKDVIWASGTPVKAIGLETIPLFSCIDPMFDNDAQKRFMGIYGKNASRALDILSNRLGLVMFQVHKEEVMAGKLRPIYSTVKVKIPNSKDYLLSTIRDAMVKYTEERLEYYARERANIRKFYDECVAEHEAKLTMPSEQADCKQYKQYINIISKGYDPRTMVSMAMYCNQYELKRIIPSLPRDKAVTFKDIRAVVKYVELKVRGECLGRIVGKSRVNCAVDMVRYIDFENLMIESDKKTVVFTTYVDVVDATYDRLTADGYKVLRVYGKTNNELESIVGTFDKDPDANPLVATFESLSTAVPLTMASTLININQPFRSYKYEQAVARLDRLGQDSQVRVFDCILDTGNEDNISSRTIDILKWSEEQVNAILGKYGFRNIDGDPEADPTTNVQ